MPASDPRSHSFIVPTAASRVKLAELTVVSGGSRSSPLLQDSWILTRAGRTPNGARGWDRAVRLPGLNGPTGIA